MVFRRPKTELGESVSGSGERVHFDTIVVGEARVCVLGWHFLVGVMAALLNHIVERGGSGGGRACVIPSKKEVFLVDSFTRRVCNFTRYQDCFSCLLLDVANGKTTLKALNYYDSFSLSSASACTTFC